MTVPEVWVPVTMQPVLMPESKFLELPDCSWLNLIGRMKDGVALEQLQAQMQLVAAQTDHNYPGRKTTVNAMPGSYVNFLRCAAKERRSNRTMTIAARAARSRLNREMRM
jgi:hypothetical protein